MILFYVVQFYLGHYPFPIRLSCWLLYTQRLSFDLKDC